ncbi:MAG: hypothetical protein AAFV71_26270 [Cyanobacteria bacterium J06633_8]
MNFNQLRNGVIATSMLLNLASTVAIFAGNENTKRLGLFGLGAGLSSMVVFEVAASVASKENKNTAKSLQDSIQDKEKEVIKVEKLINERESEVKTLLKDTDKLHRDIEKLEYIIKSKESVIQTRNNELTEASRKITNLQEKLKNIGQFNASESHRIVRETFKRQVKKVNCVINALIRNHPDYSEELQIILDEFETSRLKFLKKIEEYEAINNFDDLLDIGLELQEMIIDKSFELRSKAQQLIIKDFASILDDSVEYEEVEQMIGQLTAQAGEQIETVKSNLEADKRAIASEWVVSNEQIINRYETEYTETLNTAKKAVARLESLEIELAELRKPLQLFGDSTYARAANSISTWYYSKYGYILDAITWEETETGYKLLFAIRRNPGLLESDLYSDNSREQLAAFTNALYKTLPEFDFNRQNSTVTLTVQLRPKVKKVISPEEFTQNVRDELQPPDRLINFVNEAYHVGLWAETGSGKTTAISNIIGGMLQVLEGKPTIKTTIPKIDEDSAKIFPTVDWLGIPNSIFGLLEAALEIQFRIHKNEQAYLNKKPMPKFAAIIFFIDEINAIFGRWKRVNDADLDDVLARFKSTLDSGERLEYFERYMEVELRNYKSEFAKRLLLFTWQTGRSLNVKSLISGQNLMPGQFGITKNDLANCSYLALGDAPLAAAKYKVSSTYQDEITAHKERIDEAKLTDPSLKYVGLYCPQGKPYFGILPPPNYYQWGGSPQQSTNSNYMKEEKYFANSRNTTATKVDSIPDNMDLWTDKVDFGWTGSPQKSSLKHPTGKLWTKMDYLDKPFKNLDYRGVLDLYAKLPKKADGSVHKLKAYSQVFKVSKSSHRKIYSEFIDYLEQEFR